MQGMQQFKTKDLLECDYTVSSLLNGLKNYKVEKCESILSRGTRESSPRGPNNSWPITGQNAGIVVCKVDMIYMLG
jgi:hypothetical protein